VDEVTADDLATYVYTDSTSYETDLYNVQDHSTGEGTINHVTVYFRFANATAAAGDGITHAIAYEGDGGDGYLKTVEITTDGQITEPVIDTLEFDPVDGHTPNIIHISGNVYAIAYRGEGGSGGDGYLKTVEITTDGQITEPVIDTLEFDPVLGYDPNIIHVSGNVYAIAYQGDSDDGFLKTVEIALNGQITDTVIDSLEFDPVDGHDPNIIHVSGNVYAIAYEGSGTDGFLKTVEIATNGQITDTVIDTLEFETELCYSPNIIHVSGNVYAMTYGGPNEDGFVKTVEIATNGQITDAVIDTLEFDTDRGLEPNMLHISGSVYAIAYRGTSGSDGFVKTIEIATNGQITDTVIDSLEFDTLLGMTPNIISVSDGGDEEDYVYARAVIKTHDTVYTGDEESTTSGFVTESYQWTTNPYTSSAWTWDEIDDLQAGVDLKTADASDSAACTQVYVVVNYGYGELEGCGDVPTGNLFEITPNTCYTGDLLIEVYLTNVAALKKAYAYLNIKLYLEDSEESGLTPDYQVLSLDNGVARFNLDNYAGETKTLSVVGGSYCLISSNSAEWDEGWSITPEFYSEVTQR